MKYLQGNTKEEIIKDFSTRKKIDHHLISAFVRKLVVSCSSDHENTRHIAYNITYKYFPEKFKEQFYAYSLKEKKTIKNGLLTEFRSYSIMNSKEVSDWIDKTVTLEILKI